MSNVLLTLDAMRGGDGLDKALYSIGILAIAVFWLLQAGWVWLMSRLLLSAYDSQSQQSVNLLFIFTFHLVVVIFFVHGLHSSGSNWEYGLWLPVLIGTACLLFRLLTLLSKLARN